jgi:predicted DNA-binding antitoxin AbrB/MazE fold protein
LHGNDLPVILFNMIHHLDAIYDQGVFRPVSPLSLADQTRVHLTVEASSGMALPTSSIEGQRQAMLELDAELEQVPDSSPEGGLNGADHDRILYGRPT